MSAPAISRPAVFPSRSLQFLGAPNAARSTQLPLEQPVASVTTATATNPISLLITALLAGEQRRISPRLSSTPSGGPEKTQVCRIREFGLERVGQAGTTIAALVRAGEEGRADGRLGERAGLRGRGLPARRRRRRAAGAR